MIIKAIGIFMVFISCLLIGLIIADKYKSRVKELKEVRNHLQIIETEIIYTSTPIIEVMDKISKQSKEPFNYIYDHIKRELKKRDGKTLGVIWKEAFEKNKRNTRLMEEDLETIYFFGSVLGNSDRPNQLKNTQLVQNQLMKLEKKAEGERMKNEKLFRSLGLLLGLAFIIIMI